MSTDNNTRYESARTPAALWDVIERATDEVVKASEHPLFERDVARVLPTHHPAPLTKEKNDALSA